jgi:DNA-binding CsgD family transcriptional regulator
VTTGVFGGSPQEGLADRIYEASVLPEFWPDVLRDFVRLAESREGVMVATSGDGFKWIGSSALAEKLAQEHYSYEGGAERSRRLIGLQRAGFATDADVFTAEEMLRLPLYADYLIPNGFGQGIATAIQVPDGDTIIFHAEGSPHAGPVDPAVIRRLDGLRPDLARSALISARLSFERARTAVETLSGIGLAACAVDKAGVALIANRAFEAEDLLWTTRGGNRIALLDRRADRQLYDALGVLGTEQGVRSLPLVASSGGAPAVLHVVPIRRAAHDLFTRAAAILVLTKASEKPTQALSLLQALFDLSATEAHIAARISAGRSAEHIALADAKSVDTVRNQVKSVLQKTGCRRQVDLVRLLTQLIPPASQSPAKSGPPILPEGSVGRA